MATLCEEVQVLNAAGIDLIEEGHLMEAAEAFSHTISRLSSCVLSPTPITKPTTPNNADGSSTAQQQSNLRLEDGGTGTPPATDDMILDCGCTDEDEIMRQQDEAQVLRVKHKTVDIYCLGEGSMDPKRDEFFSQAFHFECIVVTDNNTPPLPVTDEGVVLRGNETPPQNVGKKTDFLVDGNPRQQPDYLTNDQHLAASVCSLFNLALCYHLSWGQQHQGKERKEEPVQNNKTRTTEHNTKLVGDTRLLLAALRHYEEAKSFTRSAVRLLCASTNNNTSSSTTTTTTIMSSPHDPIFKVLMAVCTNSAHCHRELGNAQEAFHWNHMLCQILAFQASFGRRPQRGGGHNHEEDPHNDVARPREAHDDHDDGDDDDHDDEDHDSSSSHSFFAVNAFLNRLVLHHKGGAAQAA